MIGLDFGMTGYCLGLHIMTGFDMLLTLLGKVILVRMVILLISGMMILMNLMVVDGKKVITILGAETNQHLLGKI